MPTIIFHPDVELEVTASHQWYQQQAAGLGGDFLTELDTAFQAILELPETWPIFQFGFRRFLLSKFPFSVIYRFSSGTVYVVAVMHNSRRPGYWSERN